jgi:hypothetical protein
MTGIPVAGPESLGQPQTILDTLTGQKVLAARTSYGDELQLHFGRPRPYRIPQLADRPRGEWVLTTRASPWRLDGAADVAALVGSRVARVALSFPDLELRITFDGELAFAIPVNEESDGLAAWELFTPDALVLTAGPGRCWSVSKDTSPADS